MGAWGTGLYQDDDTCDIKEEYLTYLRIGMSNEEALEELIECNEELIEDEEIGPLFWLALADTQWKYGRLTKEVKEKALEVINSGKDLERWEKDKKLYEKRKKVLEELRERLNTKQPEEKKVRKMTFERPNWKVGDILLYQILNEDLKDHEWYGKYVLLKVMGTKKHGIGGLPIKKYYHENEVFSLYNWIGNAKIEKDKIDTLKIIFWEENEYNSSSFRLIGEYDLTKEKIKKLNIKLLKNDTNYLYNEELEKKYPFYYWYNINNFDKAVIRALEREDKKGNLVKDL